MRSAYSEDKTQTTTGFDLGRIAWLRPKIGSESIGELVSESDYEKQKETYVDYIVKKVELKGVPGKMHFSIIRSILAKGCDGVIFLIDGCEMDHIKNSIEILKETKNYLDKDIPLKIIANKSDKEGYLGRVKISSLIQEDVLEASVKTKRGIIEAITSILEQILRKNTS